MTISGSKLAALWTKNFASLSKTVFTFWKRVLILRPTKMKNLSIISNKMWKPTSKTTLKNCLKISTRTYLEDSTKNSNKTKTAKKETGWFWKSLKLRNFGPNAELTGSISSRTLDTLRLTLLLREETQLHQEAPLEIPKTFRLKRLKKSTQEDQLLCYSQNFSANKISTKLKINFMTTSTIPLKRPKENM